MGTTKQRDHILRTRYNKKTYPKQYAQQRRIHFFSTSYPTLMKVRETLTISVTSIDDADVILAYPAISA